MAKRPNEPSADLRQRRSRAGAKDAFRDILATTGTDESPATTVAQVKEAHRLKAQEFSNNQRLLREAARRGGGAQELNDLRDAVTLSQRQGRDIVSLTRLQNARTPQEGAAAQESLLSQVGPNRQAFARSSAQNVTDVTGRFQQASDVQAARLGGAVRPDLAAGGATPGGLAAIGRTEAPFARGGAALGAFDQRGNDRIREAQIRAANAANAATPTEIVLAEGRLQRGFGEPSDSSGRNFDGSLKPLTPEQTRIAQLIRDEDAQRALVAQQGQRLGNVSRDAVVAQVEQQKAEFQAGTRSAGGVPSGRGASRTMGPIEEIRSRRIQEDLALEASGFGDRAEIDAFKDQGAKISNDSRVLFDANGIRPSRTKSGGELVSDVRDLNNRLSEFASRIVELAPSAPSVARSLARDLRSRLPSDSEAVFTPDLERGLSLLGGPTFDGNPADQIRIDNEAQRLIGTMKALDRVLRDEVSSNELADILIRGLGRT